MQGMNSVFPWCLPLIILTSKTLINMWVRIICITEALCVRQNLQENEGTATLEVQFTWGESRCSEGAEEFNGELSGML